MARENSFSDSDGRSLTPDLSDEDDFDVPSSPVQATAGENNMNQGEKQGGRETRFPPPNVQPRDGSALPPAITSASPSVVIQPPTPAILEQTVSAPARVPTRSPTSDTPSASIDQNATLLRPGLPSERFRASVRKVIHMNRGFSKSMGGIGAEPGIDPRRSSAYLHYGHIRQRCQIELVDYSSVRASFGKMENKGFVEFMADPQASKREPWVKVRWINIGGVSWDVISSLAIKYGTSSATRS